MGKLTEKMSLYYFSEINERAVWKAIPLLHQVKEWGEFIEKLSDNFTLRVQLFEELTL